jgi:hypothetical protein
MDGEELPVKDGHGQQSTEERSQQKPAYGFFLVLAAIVVVAIMYSVTIFALGNENRTPETVFGAMAASFTVIGTLVGTYFGIKAGLDGQDKVKDAVGKAIGESEDRLRTRAQRNGDRTDGKVRADGQSVATSEPRRPKRSDPEEQQDWEKVGV